MKESKLVSLLLPSHPDLLPILQNIRKKYNIPEIDPNELLIDILGDDFQRINWVEVRQDIENQIRNIPDFLPPEIMNLVHYFNSPNDDLSYLLGSDEVPDEIKKQLTILLSTLVKPLLEKIDSLYKLVSDSLFESLLTSVPIDFPDDWLGGVITVPVSGGKIIVAMASHISDPKVISTQFRQEYTKIFGKYRPRLTERNLKVGEYLRLHLAGMRIKDIVDVYIQRHKSEFPKDPRSKEYREAKHKYEETMKKRLQRLQEAINIIFEGDK